MFFVLALCAVALLATTAAALLLMGFFSGKRTETGDTASATPQDSESMVTESGYNKDQNTIDAAQYTTTILEESADAGQSYIDETLFVGDSNTARMYRGGLSGSYATYANAIGSVGMAASALKDYACVQLQGYKGYKTMPEAVALLQPKRVILSFGTNDLNPSRSADAFVASYEEGIQAVVEAYPSVDVIVNAIPPLGKEHSNANLTQNQVDEYNKALVELCRKNNWKFLNSAEALKDTATGYAKSDMVISTDGIHLTDAGMTALFKYVRTHSYITDDDRPTLKTIPTHTGDKDVVVYTVPVVATAAPEATEAPEANGGESSGEILSDSTGSSSSQITYTYWDEVIAPTDTNQGYTIHHCNEDSSKDYTDSYTDPLGHDFQNGVCTRCGATDPNYVATPAPTPVPEVSTPAPESTASSSAEATAAPAESTADPGQVLSTSGPETTPDSDSAAAASE